MELRYRFDPERFYLGTPCKHGHAWPGTKQCLRRLRGSVCVGCNGRRQSDWLVSFLDYEAMGWPNGQTLGKLCRNGHRWQRQRLTLRHHGKCMECERIRKQSDNYKATRAQYTQTNKEKIREQTRIRARKQYAQIISNSEFAEKERERKRRNRSAFSCRLRQRGLTNRGTVPIRLDGLVPRSDQPQVRAAMRAIRNAGRCPSVARLVMNEQQRYWREHPEAKREHDKQWARASWWLQYQINPDLRLYVRQKSKRRKALLREQMAHQIKPKQLRARFAQFDNRCAYCGAAGDMQIEHVVAISKGGTHAIGNIVPACRTCNYSKREHEVERWYRAQPQFSEKRWKRICRVLGWDRGSVGQLALL